MRCARHDGLRAARTWLRLVHNRVMARLFPDGVDTVSAGSALEAPTALRLADELPADWWVIHACHWTLPRGHKIGQGEVDFVVISPGGTIGLVEQKNGMVSVEGADYVKHYGLRRKSVSQQMGRSRHALMKKLAEAQIEPRAVVSFLYVPDVEVVRVRGAGIDALAVIDAREASELAHRLEMLLHCEPENLALVRALLNFFAGELDFRPSLHALKAASTAAQVRLSGALRMVLEGFSMHPMRLCMEACAGAGKSEFIRLLAERSVAAGRRTLALCYNRPLAALLREALPEQVEVDTWLGFRRRCAEALGLILEFPAVADKAFWESSRLRSRPGWRPPPFPTICASIRSWSTRRRTSMRVRSRVCRPISRRMAISCGSAIRSSGSTNRRHPCWRALRRFVCARTSARRKASRASWRIWRQRGQSSATRSKARVCACCRRRRRARLQRSLVRSIGCVLAAMRLRI